MVPAVKLSLCVAAVTRFERIDVVVFHEGLNVVFTVTIILTTVVDAFVLRLVSCVVGTVWGAEPSEEVGTIAEPVRFAPSALIDDVLAVVAESCSIPCAIYPPKPVLESLLVTEVGSWEEVDMTKSVEDVVVVLNTCRRLEFEKVRMLRDDDDDEFALKITWLVCEKYPVTRLFLTKT
jgi:hypothetical protein